MTPVLVADTTFLIDVSRGDEGAAKVIRDADASGELLATTFVNAFEFQNGLLFGTGRRREQAQEFLNRLHVLNGDKESAVLAAHLAFDFQQRGLPLGEMDLLVAGIVLRWNGVLLSRDTGFSRLPGLTLRSY